MHILITINASWNALNFRLPIIDALLSDGHHITLLAPYDDSVPKLQARGVKHVQLDMDTKGLSPVRDAALMRRLKTHFKHLKPDVILSYTIKNNIFGAFAAKQLRIPFIPNVSGLGTAFLSGKLLQFIAEQLYRRAYSNLQTVFFQNSEDRDLFLERRLLKPQQANVIPGSGIDLERFSPSPLPEGPPVFLMIGRLLRDKGVIEYVDAAREIRKIDKSAVFQLLGATDSVNRSAVSREKVAEWEAEGVISYLGTTDDVRPFITRATAVVLPSYREGAPRTLIEAAAMGRPVIATDVPGCRAVVDHSVTGFLCEVKSAESLAIAFQSFLDMPHQNAVSFGNAGRQKMEKSYSQDVVVKAYMDAINKIPV